MRTYTAKTDEASRWWLVDAEGKTLGRLATQLAIVLRGKHRPDYTPHILHGDHVVVVNAAKVVVTGKKAAEKRYYRHSGYPGGLSERTLADMLASHPERVIRLAVRGMLPRGRLRRRLVDKMKVYAGTEHPHQAQRPEPLAIGQRREERES